MLSIRKAAETDIPAIQELAEKTWAVAYASILPPAQMSYMLDLFYSTAALHEQMKKGHRFILAIDTDEAFGFASYSPKESAELALPQKNIYRLHKIYIDPGQQGKGVGKLLLDHIINDIRPLGATALELNVNRSNAAIGFYQKYGFRILYEEDIDIGNGYFMNDYVMEYKVEG